MSWLGWGVAGVLGVLWITAVTNFIFFPRLKKHNNRDDETSYSRHFDRSGSFVALREPKPKRSGEISPSSSQQSTVNSQQSTVNEKLSVLIPARNEAGVIGETIGAILAQTVAEFELIVLDDQSEDGTAAIVREWAGRDERVRMDNGRSLPTGWLGKNWACQQLAQAATGDLLLFLDADVTCQPEAFAALLAVQNETQADLLTVWPTQRTKTWGERLVIPQIALAILAYLPILPVHFTYLPAFAAANGQCLLFRKSAYQTIGGHASVKDKVVEDVALARKIKQQKLRLRMADGNRLVQCRMYRNWQEVRDGISKNLLAGHSNSVPFLTLSTLFHWLLFVFPWLWLLFGGGWWAVGLIFGSVGLRAVTAVFTHQRPQDALLMPLSVLLMTRIAYRSVRWHWQGGGVWKGRVLRV